MGLFLCFLLASVSPFVLLCTDQRRGHRRNPEESSRHRDLPLSAALRLLGVGENKNKTETIEPQLAAPGDVTNALP
ncbi:hypothetical protein MRX96_055567 [Rhipicephalus microplus]